MTDFGLHEISHGVDAASGLVFRAARDETLLAQDCQSVLPSRDGKPYSGMCTHASVACERHSSLTTAASQLRGLRLGAEPRTSRHRSSAGSCLNSPVQALPLSLRHSLRGVQPTEPLLRASCEESDRPCRSARRQRLSVRRADGHFYSKWVRIQQAHWAASSSVEKRREASRASRSISWGATHGLVTLATVASATTVRPTVRELSRALERMAPPTATPPVPGFIPVT